MRLPSSSIWNVYILSGTPDKSSLQEPILVSGKKGFKHFAFIEMFPSLWFFASARFKLAVERQMGHEGGQAKKKRKLTFDKIEPRFTYKIIKLVEGSEKFLITLESLISHVFVFFLLKQTFN